MLESHSINSGLILGEFIAIIHFRKAWLRPKGPALPAEVTAPMQRNSHKFGATSMTNISVSEAAKAVVRRNTEEVQGGGNFEVFEELFADDFLDHTPQPGRTPDKAGARELYKVLRAAFPDFHADIHWQLADGDRVTTYKTYHGTHRGEFFGIAPTGRKIQFETVDVMGVHDGKITEHWGVANLFSLMQQLGALPGTSDRQISAQKRT
jgi:steroid delta-isomerase-like uncharacterized protein